MILEQVPQRRVERFHLLDMDQEIRRAFDRRQNPRGDRGRVPQSGGGAAPATTPLTIFPGLVPLWVRGDLGSPSSALWPDQSGNGNDLTGVGTPTYNAAGLNGKGTFTFVRASAQRFQHATLPLAAPGTTPLTVYAVIKANAWNSLASVCGGHTAATLRVLQVTASPEMRQANVTQVNANTGAAISSWVLLIAKFTNSASDSLKLGSGAAVTGAIAGNSSATGYQIAASASGTHISMDCAELFLVTKNASGAEDASVATYITGIWGGTVAV